MVSDSIDSTILKYLLSSDHIMTSKIILSVLFSILLLGSLSAVSMVYADSVTISDQTSCEDIPDAIWSTSPDTCTINTPQTITSDQTWTISPLVDLVINSEITMETNSAINGGNITINTSDDINISGTINAAAITINANNTTIGTSGSIDASGDIVLNSSNTINTGGIIDGNGNITIIASGSVTNFGTINNSGSVGGNIILGIGTIDNNGVIVAGSGTIDNNNVIVTGGGGTIEIIGIDTPIDITPPLIGPILHPTIFATDPEGEIVDYPLPTVFDDIDPNPTISCDPEPGSLFPIGITDVTCTAEDASGNISTITFPVTVQLPPQIFICSPSTIEQIISSGQYNIIDNRDGSLGNVLTGTISNDLILASDVGNTISGRAGSDCIIGGTGDDIINGNFGDDTIFGLNGNDRLVGGFGLDNINGGEGSDIIFGNIGADFLDGGEGSDIIFGNIGADFLDGGEGSDIISGGIGIDTCVSDAEDTTPAILCEL